MAGLCHPEMPLEPLGKYILTCSVGFKVCGLLFSNSLKINPLRHGLPL